MGHTNSVVMALSLCPNPTIFQKTLSVNDFYRASSEWEFPMGHISFVGKLDLDTLQGGSPGDCSWLESRVDGATLARFLAHFGRSSRP